VSRHAYFKELSFQMAGVIKGVSDGSGIQYRNLLPGWSRVRFSIVIATAYSEPTWNPLNFRIADQVGVTTRNEELILSELGWWGLGF
jgi:hypothetical protein